MIDSTTQKSLVSRMIGAARLDVNTYEDVEADETATGQAATAVVIVAVLSAVGAVLGTVIRNAPSGLIGAAIGAIIGSLLGWVVWSYVTYFVGTRLFGGTATPGEMLRTIGFAQSPGALNVLSFIPVLGGIISIVVAIWMLVTGVVAVRQALDFDTGKAILTALVGWLALVLITAVLAAIFGGAFYALGGMAS